MTAHEFFDGLVGTPKDPAFRLPGEQDKQCKSLNLMTSTRPL